MNTFTLVVLAAEKPFYEGECETLIIPSTDGAYGIQANHHNVIVAIIPGTLKIIYDNGKEIIAAVSGGIVKVENNYVLLMVDTIERPEEIDENRAKRAAEEAREAILQKKSIQDYQAAQAKMARAINRLRVKKHNDFH